jgi:7-keto-8-aminopelargonate synthetase-like enzyme
MDGDCAPLRELLELKEKYGAWLMVDEAHATGLYGANRRGLAEEMGVGEQIEIQMGTLGKALGAAGGYICGSRRLVDYLVNRARTFIFSTAPVPAAAAAAAAGIELVRSSEGEARRRQLRQRIAELDSKLKDENSKSSAAIIPLVIGEEAKAMEIAAALLEEDIFVPAIRYPSVPRGEARLRITISAAHTSAQIEQLTSALKPWTAEFRTAIRQK